MNINICLVVAGICFLDSVIFAEGQDCQGYVLITDSRRTTQQVFNSITDTPISDTDVDPDKWYRFRSYVGVQIPERPVGESVEMNRCGTTYPIFITGLNQHPIRDDESTTATAKVGTWEREINIYQCPPDVDGDSFYIYRLVVAPAEETAYCAGDGVPCDAGFMHNGITCVDYFPMMKGPPILSGPHNTIGSNEEKQFYFTCKVQYDRVPDDSFARFWVTFLFDGFELESVGPRHHYLPSFEVEPSDDISVQLTEYYLRGRLGREIQCKVRSYWEENSEKSNAIISVERYKATLEAVQTFDFDLKKGTEQKIPFHPTVPFTYFHCSVYDCPKPFIYNFFLKTEAATDIDCSLKWNGTDPQLAVLIKPFASSRIFEVKFQPYDGDFFQESSSLWHNFVIPTVTIRAFQSSDTWCRGTGDPHVTTFDGLYYDAYFNGDYYMVAESTPSTKLEVQVRQETCNGNVACNCGVIVREMNSVLKVSFDQCGQWNAASTRPLSIVRLLTQIPDDGTEITRDEGGKKFSIRLPSGTRVEVSAITQWFGVEVNLAPMYIGKLSVNSLCGNSNGNKDDDSTDTNIARIVDPANSYFNALPECMNDFYPAAKNCTCAESGTGAECPAVEQNIEMKSPAKIQIDTSTMWSSGKICVDPDHKSLVQHNSGESNADYILDPADLFPPFIPDPSAGHNLTLKWPTPKNKTKAEVEQYCLNMLTGTPVYTDCNTVANTDLTLLQCVSDTQIADEYFVTTSYADSFQQECVNVLIEQENNATEEGTTPSVNVSTIYSQICPAQCSGHGSCVDATCTCNAGYLGADCSIDESKPPVLTGVARSGICDIQQRPCAAVSVFGSGFISSDTVRCRFSTMGGGSPLDANGTLVTGSEVSCSVPNITTERAAITRQGISVANDGALYSNILEFVTFDSVCMSCGQDKVCTQKADACLISDRCYVNGAMKDNQTCQHCSPSQSISSWTDMPVTDKLQSCSRTCDYGAQIKETVCTMTNAVVKTEAVLCKDSSCAAIPEENLQGVIMNISNEDTTKILLTPADILSQVAEVVNNYCSAHATQCCNSVGVPNGISLSSFTSLELCPYGSGYPQVGDTSSRIKVIVKIIPSQVQDECVKGAPQRSTDGQQAYANPDIIVTAVTEGKEFIEMALNITIVSVEKDDGSSGAGGYSGAGLPVAKHTLILVATVTTFVIIRLF